MVSATATAKIVGIGPSFTSQIDTVPTPSSGCYLGTSATSWSEVETLDRYIEPRHFAAIRVYTHIDMGSALPSLVTAAGRAGRLVVLSVRSDRVGGAIPDSSVSGGIGAWKGMVAGHQDSYLAQIVTALKAYPYPLWLSYCHEPYRVANRMAVGSWSGGNPGGYPNNRDSVASEWKAAYDYLANYLLTHGVANVSFAPILQTQYEDAFDTWLPAHHDWIFNDSYPKPGQSFAQANSTFYNWAHADHPTVPLGIGETAAFASDSTDSGAAGWYADVPAGLTSQPQVKCWCQWDGDPWYTAGLTQTKAAFAKMAQASIFSPT